jgi:hypothetical protein
MLEDGNIKNSLPGTSSHYELSLFENEDSGDDPNIVQEQRKVEEKPKVKVEPAI